MVRIAQNQLFGWRESRAPSDLDLLKAILSELPDEGLMQKIEQRRGRGRNDYPPRPMWNMLIAGVVLGHDSISSLLREMRRNAELREVCGFDPMRGSDAVPTPSAVSRFKRVLREFEEDLREIIYALVRKLCEMLPNFGKNLAIDSKAIEAYARNYRRKKEKKREKSLGRKDYRRENDADIGVKRYRYKDSRDKIREVIKSWFGFKLHLIVDVYYEMPVGFKVTEASRSDSSELLPMMRELEQMVPEVVKRAETLSGDKAYDSRKNNEELYDNYGIKPIIQIRDTWKLESTKPVFEDRVEPFVYDEKGNVYCCIPHPSGQGYELVDMAFMGFEKKRRCLKYRCPAAAYGIECTCRRECESGVRVGSFGRTIRIPIDLDRRVFTPIARSSYKWKSLSKRRSAVERVNSRLDEIFRLERHRVRGLLNITIFVEMILMALLAMALARIRAGQIEEMRSFRKPLGLAA